MKLEFIVAALVVFTACKTEPDPTVAITRSAQVTPRPAREVRILAAAELTQRYADSKLKEWEVRVSATGNDCRVLFVATPVIMEETMVEAMHYGAGAYKVGNENIDRFYRDKNFRGVAYRDGSGSVWKFGDITKDETQPPCN